MKNIKGTPGCAHFREEGHNFIKHAKFTLIDPLTEIENVNTAILKLRSLDIKTRNFDSQSSKSRT